MKKFILLLTFVAICAFSLCACNNEKNEEDKEKEPITGGGEIEDSIVLEDNDISINNFLKD